MQIMVVHHHHLVVIEAEVSVVLDSWCSLLLAEKTIIDETILHLNFIAKELLVFYPDRGRVSEDDIVVIETHRWLLLIVQ